MKKLLSAIRAKKAPVVVGLDPQLKFIPGTLLDEVKKELGETPEAVAEAFYRFNVGIMDAVSDIVPAVKPQIAMYEQFGVAGVMAFKKTVDYAHKKGLVVIGDIKRGDIGSTSGAYASGHLGSESLFGHDFTPFGEDIVTVNPYLGTDGVQPFIDVARQVDGGIFVLVKTSNPSSGEFQDVMVGDRAVYELVGEMVEKWGSANINDGYSDVGAVVGATYPEIGRKMREQMPHTFILVPGYGAQGGKGEDIKVFFDDNGEGAIVNSSRGIIAAYQKEEYSSFGEAGFADAARAATEDMIKDITTHLG